MSATKVAFHDYFGYTVPLVVILLSKLFSRHWVQLNVVLAGRELVLPLYGLTTGGAKTYISRREENGTLCVDGAVTMFPG